MANTETSVSNLKINRLTQTQLDNATSVSNSELYMVDPEFAGGKVLMTDSNGDIIESDVIPTNIGTVKSVNSTSPDSNGNVSLTIPTVNNPTITITQGGTTKGSFTLNQSSGDTIALDAGGGTATDVQINGTSITTNNVANILTEGQYSTLNKIATMATIPDTTNLANKNLSNLSSTGEARFTAKVSTSDCTEVYPVIQTYQSGTSWYRIYSDGWCEQGGLVSGTSVTFLKTFNSLPNVSVGITTLSGTSSFNYNTAKGYFGYNLSTTGFDCQNNGQYWVARGYLAEGQY